MPIDARGAIVRGPTFTGFFEIEAPGFVHPDNFKELPGAKLNEGLLPSLPANVIPIHNVAPKHQRPPSGIRLHDYQKEAVAFIHGSMRGALICLDVGCHRAGQGILLADGTVKHVEDIVVGDRVMGADGRAQSVLRLTRGHDEMFTVTPTKGAPFIVNGDHILALWKVPRQSEPSYPCYAGKHVEMTVREWLACPPSVRKLCYKLERSDVVVFEDEPLLEAVVDPYLLGLFLGDGSFPTCSICNPEKEVREYLGFITDYHGWRIRTQDDGVRCSSFHISTAHGRPNPLREAFKRLGLAQARCADKFIPVNYKRSSVENRALLLAGLLDTDGHYTGGCYEIISKGKQLAEDICFVARSLGLAAYRKEKEAYCQTGGGGIYHRVMISGELDRIPCKVARKKPQARTQKKSVLRTGFTIEPTGTVEPYYGFTLDGDGRFLLDDFTITHNCGKTLCACQYAFESPTERPLLVIGPLSALTSWVGDDSDPTKHYGWRFHRIEHEWSPEAAEQLPRGADGYFINFELAHSWKQYLKETLQPRIVIFDEAHELRNGRTQAYKAAANIAYRARKRIVLTATPVVHEISDLWTQLNLAQPKHWGWVEEWGPRYSNWVRGEYGWKRGNESNVEELQQRLLKVLFRRSRFDMLKELPPLEREVIEVGPEQLDPAVYQQYRATAAATSLAFLAQGKKPQALELQRAVDLLNMLSRAKWPAALEAALRLTSEHWKVVVWCWYRETAEYLSKRLREAKVEVFGPVHGGVTKARRDKLAKGFRDIPEDAIPNGAVFVTTIGTSGRAMNELVKSNCALFVDLAWTPIKLLQCEGRQHRQGQTAPCYMHYLIARHTVDDWMWGHLNIKARAIEAGASDGSALSLTESLGGVDDKKGLDAFFAAVAGVQGDGTR